MTEKDQPDEISPDDRRRHDRSRLIVDVHFDGADSIGLASTKDISRGGLYLATQSRIPVGATLAMRIPLGQEHLVVTGEVVYSSPGEGVGVKFRDLSADALALIEESLR